MAASQSANAGRLKDLGATVTAYGAGLADRIAALGDTPVGTPIDAPVGTPVDAPVGTPVDAPVGTPVDAPVDIVFDTAPPNGALPELVRAAGATPGAS